MVDVDVATATAVIVMFLIVALPTAYRIYRRRRRMQRTMQPEDGDEPSKPKVSLTVPKFPTVHNKLKIFAAIVTFIVVIVILAESVVIVQPGHRGVVLTLGEVQPVVLGEGFHTITPFVQSVIQIEVRTLKYEASAGAASKDLQDVQSTVALNYRLDPAIVNKIYQTIGEAYADKIIAPTIQESVKASTAKFNAEDLITQREQAKTTIGDAIRKELANRGIIAEQIFITDFKFSGAFQAQIEAKVVAAQEALTQENLLKSKLVQAQQRVVEAKGVAEAQIEKSKGEAESIRIINEELAKSPKYLEWQMLNKWDGKLPIAMGQGFFPFLDITQLRQPE
ncbi:MAG: prohibitin family protein [Nitrososphaerales archaeon]